MLALRGNYFGEVGDSLRVEQVNGLYEGHPIIPDVFVVHIDEDTFEEVVDGGGEGVGVKVGCLNVLAVVDEASDLFAVLLIEGPDFVFFGLGEEIGIDFDAVGKRGADVVGAIVVGGAVVGVVYSQ